MGEPIMGEPIMGEPINGVPPPAAPQKTSTLGSAFNVLCIVVGTGLFSLPFGFRQTGWVGAPILVVMSCIACYTASVLVSCFDLAAEAPIHAARLLPDASSEPTAARPKPKTYGDIGFAAFGTAGRWFVTVQQHLTLFLVATVYQLLPALNLMQLLPGQTWLTQPVAVLLVAAPVWPHVFLRTLSEVAWLSYLNMAISIAFLAAVLYATADYPPDSPPSRVLLEREVLSVGGGFSSFAFAYGVHPVLPAVRENMRRPADYNRMIMGCFAAIVVVFYLPVACAGYYQYGDQVLAPIYATKAMAQAPVIKGIVGLITVNLIFTYPLVINTPEIALEEKLGVGATGCRALVLRSLLRSCFVAATTAIACVVDVAMFPPFIDLISSVTVTFTSFILPCVFYLKLRSASHQHRLPAAVVLLNACIIFIAALGAVFGGVDAIKELVKAVKR